MTTSRSVARIVDAIRTVEGEGFIVRRPFPTARVAQFDPFLLLDEMGPIDLRPGEAKGAPDHPHRGFETVTYVLEGSFEHEDSAGHAGKLGAGDVQWMTAGAGVVHSEMPSRELQARGGRVHGVQLWVNLPRADKMMAPRYQEVPGASIPVAEADGGRVRVKVIAGEALGARAVIDTRTPITYLHFTLAPGASVTQPVPAGHNAMTYVLRGAGSIGGTTVGDGQLALLADDGAEVTLANGSDARAPLELLLLSGLPLREPVVRYGPFVMTSEAEIHQAIRDYQTGRMGTGSYPPTT
jgi:redox-sensitive bicupin YhaK (pirin superfamily)